MGILVDNNQAGERVGPSPKMSFFGKFKPGSTPSSQSAAATAAAKKDLNVPVPTPLEKHLQDVPGPIRPDGSDKFFGFENYGSTWYVCSIVVAEEEGNVLLWRS